MKIPNFVRLGGLGPSADTTAKRKKQVVPLVTLQQPERYLVKFLSMKCLKTIFLFFAKKKNESVDLQHKNEYHWLNPCCTFSLRLEYTVHEIAIEQKEGDET